MIFFLDENFPKMAHTIPGNADWFLKNYSQESKYNNRCFLLTDNSCTFFE